MFKENKMAAKQHIDLDIGLTTPEVSKRIKQGLVNEATDNQFKSNWQIIAENTFTYFNLIFAILAGLLIVVGSYRDLSFLPVIIANTIIGIVQEIRAKHVLSKLTVMNEAEVLVIRDGKKIRQPIEKLVQDDVVILTTGDQIPADGRVLACEARVNEALLTGEADEIKKTIGSELMSGSFLVSGEIYMQLEKVGNESYIAKLTLEAKAMKSVEQSEMVRSINKIIKWVGIIIIPLGIALFSQSYFLNHAGLAESITSMEAAIIGMIPEGLYLLTTIALAMAATRLARRRVMLHNMKSVETLARVNVLCVDKTGTITEPVMTVQKAITSNNVTNSDLNKYLADFSGNMPVDNETMKAVSEKFKTRLFQKAKLIVPFTSVNKYSAAVFEEYSLVLGAPEMVLRADFEKYLPEFQSYVESGYRVVVFAKYPKEISENSPLTESVSVLGYILINNPIRKEAPATFKYFAKQGVDIKVISGDNPVTVSRVAREAGIRNSEKYIDLSKFNGEYKDAVKEYTVFGRVKPDQKKKLILALKEVGKTVAMTGDGVNDILAMKEADCSIAMASGNSAAVQASQVVLLDSNFAKMPDVVNEGRRVVNNIERSASLFLVKNIFSFLMSIISLMLTVNYPLRPSQITLISAFTIGLPSFLLALESNHNIIRGNFIANVLSKSIPGGLTDMLAVWVLIAANMALDLGHKDLSTTATMVLVAVGMMVLYHISEQFRLGVMVIAFFTIVVSIVFFHHFFALTMISGRSIFLLVVLFFAEVSIFRWLSAIADGMAEVGATLVQNGRETTFAQVKAAYKRGKNN
ncbi:MAG: cation-translocating P-type ATPase [Lactobacillus mulieris]|uniref:Cation-translocating P-type ATPase n=1 Tax=Lactobacillus mulieris TaxID=2508708 RepID=A0AAP3GXS4_9LACO|nr:MULTISPECIES: cation-translocating P-type ATPase [Lactobacillus]KAA9245331.1 cation-translocating P-type ATPase [Lactobacillus jensenii]MCF1796910.1 cation-translocating P-type ATPase [Lactobacillus mulieris]MCT7674523.1 cation-translocating P-type ATPase [Lactobacillus mulieris]MCT7772470.1 cation-translocating P-type ATPase [Lactobacillus mulieris]MCW8093863.1 cation-translocating P-type ATPase [Lactobacillus mulieris]